MVFTISSDLDTLLTNNFVHTNVTDLTADPAIYKVGDDPPDTFPSNGEIIIDEERLTTTNQQGGYKQEIYSLVIKVSYLTATTPTTLKEMIAEIARVFNTENLSTTRANEWFITYQWPGGYEEGAMNLLITAASLFTAVST